MTIIFGIFGFIFTSIYYILSARSFLKLLKENSKLEEINFYKILFNYMISFFNYSYSDFFDYSSIYRCNIFGLYFSLSLIIIYIFFEFKIDLTDSIINILLIGITSFSFFYYFYYILVDADIYGYFLFSANIIGLLNFLYENYYEYKKELNKSFYFYTNIAYTIAAFCWFIYGFLYFDYYIKLIFGVETFCGIFVIIMNNYYDKLFKDYSSIGNAVNKKFNNMPIDGRNNIEFVDEKKEKYENL